MVEEKNISVVKEKGTGIENNDAGASILIVILFINGWLILCRGTSIKSLIQ